MEEQRWWSKSTVALVTGANRGLGLQIVRELASRGITTILTSRDGCRGREAAEVLSREGLQVVYHRLDVCDAISIQETTKWVATEYPSGIDILVNNAGVMLLLDRPKLEAARKITNTNYYGLKNTTEAMLPLLKPGARIINMNSKAGDVEFVANEWGDRLQDLNRLSAAEIDQFIADFLRDVEAGRITASGWPIYDYIPDDPEAVSSYWVSKIAAAAYTRLLDRELSQQQDGNRKFGADGHGHDEQRRALGSSWSRHGGLARIATAQQMPFGGIFHAEEGRGIRRDAILLGWGAPRSQQPEEMIKRFNKSKGCSFLLCRRTANRPEACTGRSAGDQKTLKTD